MEELRETQIHRSLTRPLLLAGAERELVIVNLTIIGALIFGVGFHWMTIGVAGFLATFGHWALVCLAKKDPQLRIMYMRHVKYHPMYEALGGVEARPQFVKSREYAS